jgi:hypothetical protein
MDCTGCLAGSAFEVHYRNNLKGVVLAASWKVCFAIPTGLCHHMADLVNLLGGIEPATSGIRLYIREITFLMPRSKVRHTDADEL